MKKMITAALLATCAVGVANELPEREQLVKLVAKIRQHQRQLDGEFARLEQLLGIQAALSDEQPLNGDESINASARKATRDGIAAFKQHSFEEAKELFQEAWEQAPNSAITNFNLGLAYSRLGNTTLSRKMLKAAVDLDNRIPAATKIKAFLRQANPTQNRQPESVGLVAPEQEETQNPAVEKAQTDVINLKKQVDSYLGSKTLSVPERIGAAARVLDRLVVKASEHEELVRDHFLEVSQQFAAFEQYDRALELLGDYAEAMDGKVLPDGYHKTLLDIQGKQRRQQEVLADYINNQPEPEISHKLTRDLHELGIFAEQLEEFVRSPEVSDSDFVKVCERLKEYKWGDRAERHVIVSDRYQNLLWSSLPGTLALDRYQDMQGEKFFKNITLLADKVEGNKPQWATVDLSVNGTAVPYVLMYTYVPKHEAFIIVRLPKRDLS